MHGSSWLPAGRSRGRRTRSCPRRPQLTPFTVKSLGMNQLRQWTQLRTLIHRRRGREGGRGAGEGEVGIVGSEPAIPDRRVLGMLLHDRVARRYLDGEVGAMNPSEADFALACKLAFYCGGDMDQMRRLFLQSALVRKKTLSPRAIAGDYLGITLWNAARRQRAKGVYWGPAKPD